MTRLLKSPLGLAMLLSVVGLLTMLVGAAMQMWPQQTYRETGMVVHWYGGWILWVAAVWILFGVSRRDDSKRRELRFDLLLTAPNSPAATLEVASRRCNGRFGRIVVDKAELTPEFFKALGQVHSVTELDLRSAELSEEMIVAMESMKQIERIRLPKTRFEHRLLRELQIALPACQVLLDDGTPVDFYGTPYATKS